MTEPVFYDHEIVQASPADYVEYFASPAIILKAWSQSMFAHEVLENDGSLKSNDMLSESTLTLLLRAQDGLKRGEPVAKPVLGVGIMDNLEIGIGREIVAAAQRLDILTIPVHVRRGQATDVQALLQ